MIRLIPKIYKKLKCFPLYLTRLPSTVKVHPNSEFAVTKLIFKPGCSVTIDEHSQVPGSLIFDKENASISIGKRVFMNANLITAKSIEIGDDVMISSNVTIVDHNSHSTSFSLRSEDVVNWRLGKKDWTNVKIAPVKISNKVWIGFNSIILKGVTIGEGAIFGAGFSSHKRCTSMGNCCW